MKKSLNLISLIITPVLLIACVTFENNAVAQVPSGQTETNGKKAVKLVSTTRPTSTTSPRTVYTYTADEINALAPGTLTHKKDTILIRIETTEVSALIFADFISGSTGMLYQGISSFAVDNDSIGALTNQVINVASAVANTIS